MQDFLSYLHSSYQGWKIQKNVIRALVYRELKTQISKSNFGLFGIIIEPLVTVSIFITIFSFFRIRNSYGLNSYIFLGTGFIFFRFFRVLLIQSLHAIEANKSLFLYKRIKPIDTIIARWLIQFFLNLLIYFGLISISLFNNIVVLKNFPLLIISYSTVSIYFLGISIIVMILGARFQWIKLTMPFLIRPLFLTSGVFFTINVVPRNLHPFLIWNPLIHSIEIARHSFTDEFPLNESISYSFLLRISFIIITFSLLMYERRKLSLVS